MDGNFSEKLDQLLSNPQMMAQIKALADTMTEGAQNAPNPSSAPKEPPAEGGQNQPERPADAPIPVTGPVLPPPADRSIKQTRALLLALKPFLDAKRGEKVDKMLGMMRFAEMAGYFKNFL